MTFSNLSPPPAEGRARTMYQKIWDAHVVARRTDGTTLLYVDRHLVHEVSSPQAFAGLRATGRTVRRPDLTLAVPDHNVSTAPRLSAGEPRPLSTDPASAAQLAALDRNAADFGIAHIAVEYARQGIVHVVGPELGFTLPGTILVCGDSHTTAHGALGALAFGIGTSDVEHVLATQTIVLKPARTMNVRLDGQLGTGISAKDVALDLIGRLGVGGASGHVIEYTGSYVRAMSIEARLTLANMSIEAGARAALIAPDATTFAYLEGRPMAPREDAWDAAVSRWRALASDPGASYDATLAIDAAAIPPSVTWGISPQDVAPITGNVPDPAAFADPGRRESIVRALAYMGLAPGMPVAAIAIDHVFIGSCTNARIEDLRAAAAILHGRRVAPNIRRAIVVPGSGQVKRQAEDEGLDAIFAAAGFEWREPGCSMCVGLNDDTIPPGGRCASTSNRNFPGRQGPGSRTHLLSPAMAAAAAVTGRLTDVRMLGRA